MPTIEEIWVSNPVDQHIYATLIFEHPAFTQTHRLVLNESAPVMLGLTEVDPTTYEFTPVPGGVKTPELGDQGRQDFTITLDAVSLEVAEELDLAMDAAPEPIYVTFAEYVASEPEAPKISLRAVLKAPQLNETRFSASGAFSDPINKLFPSVLYSTTTHPGLA